MKRKSLNLAKGIIIFPILCAFFISSSQAEEYQEGYLNAKWGMSRAQVIQSLPNYTFIRAEDFIYFNDVIDGEPVQTQFYFTHNKLYVVYIWFFRENIDQHAIPNEFYRFEKLLKTKYGEPSTIWRSRIDGEDPVYTIQMRGGTYYDEWLTPESSILLNLEHNPQTIGEFILRIIYKSRKLTEMADRELAVKKL